MNKMENDINDIVDGLDNKQLEFDASLERMVLPEERLRESLLGLVEKQTREACNYDKAIGLAISSVVDKIQTNELTASELLNVISTLSNKKIDLITGILEPFKPTPNGVSLLLPPVKEKQREDDFTEGLKAMSAEELQTIQKVFDMIKPK